MYLTLKGVLFVCHCPLSANLRCLFIRTVIRNPVFQGTAIVIKQWSLNIYYEYFKYFILRRLATPTGNEGFILEYAIV